MKRFLIRIVGNGQKTLASRLDDFDSAIDTFSWAVANLEHHYIDNAQRQNFFDLAAALTGSRLPTSLR